MSEMVERVARALFENVISELRLRHPPNGKLGSDMTLDNSDTSKMFSDTARVAILAMRNPGVILARIGQDAYENGDPGDGICVLGIIDAWNAMIDEALKL